MSHSSWFTTPPPNLPCTFMNVSCKVSVSLKTSHKFKFMLTETPLFPEDPISPATLSDSTLISGPLTPGPSGWQVGMPFVPHCLWPSMSSWLRKTGSTEYRPSDYSSGHPSLEAIPSCCCCSEGAQSFPVICQRFQHLTHWLSITISVFILHRFRIH